jgi:hypothetical protein
VPDPGDDHPGQTRVMVLRRPAAPFVAFQKREFMLPEREVAPCVLALADDPDGLGRFTGYERDTAHIRDMLVCTHGARDACCATFGYPIYRELRESWASDTLRVWRASHIGGHRFAPTLIDLPEGRTWGHLDQRLAAQIVQRTGSVFEVSRCCRGWAGVTAPFEQVAEREILRRKGWEWLGYGKRGETLATSDDGTRADVRISFQNADATESGAYEARVEVVGTVPTGGCSGEGGEAPQYRVRQLDRVS